MPYLMLHRCPMFERFTDRARRSIVLAQEEARRLQHNYIGTEHVLLGLLGEETGVAARVAKGFGLTLAGGREDVLAIIGRGKGASAGHIPFTPRAKKCLELALREALQLGHDYIGTEHVLLGIVREGEGVGAQILLQHAGSLSEIRAAVVDQLHGATTEVQGRRLLGRLGGRRTAAVRLQPEPQPPEVRTTPAADISLAGAARLAGAGPLGSHHLLLAALDDPNTAAARTLLALGVDLDRAREALRTTDVTGSSDELPEEAGRRQMLITVTGDRLTLEASDAEIIELGRAAAKALRTSASTASQAGEPAAESSESEPTSAGPGVVRGDHPLSGSLGLVWQALRDSLEDIRHRAAAEARDAAARAAGEKPSAAETNPAAEPPAAPPEESAGG
jgi:Clp amino terminal domain, pathogenicity island component